MDEITSMFNNLTVDFEVKKPRNFNLWQIKAISLTDK